MDEALRSPGASSKRVFLAHSTQSRDDDLPGLEYLLGLLIGWNVSLVYTGTRIKQARESSKAHGRAR